jgi:hypothetical protein
MRIVWVGPGVPNRSSMVIRACTGGVLSGWQAGLALAFGRKRATTVVRRLRNSERLVRWLVMANRDRDECIGHFPQVAHGSKEKGYRYGCPTLLRQPDCLSGSPVGRTTLPDKMPPRVGEPPHEKNLLTDCAVGILRQARFSSGTFGLCGTGRLGWLRKE